MKNAVVNRVYYNLLSPFKLFLFPVFREYARQQRCPVEAANYLHKVLLSVANSIASHLEFDLAGWAALAAIRMAVREACDDL